MEQCADSHDEQRCADHGDALFRGQFKGGGDGDGQNQGCSHVDKGMLPSVEQRFPNAVGSFVDFIDRVDQVGDFVPDEFVIVFFLLVRPRAYCFSRKLMILQFILFGVAV